MRELKTRLRPADDAFGSLSTLQGLSWSKSKVWRRAQGIARTRSQPNARDHTSCTHLQGRVYMPTIATTKVGSRNREKSASIVEFLFDWDELLDQEGDFYSPMIAKGITLEEGEDYIISSPTGETLTLKSGPEKVRRLIVVELAERLNVPTSVKVPDSGAHIAASARNWVSFRPRMDTPFADENALVEYIEKNA